MRHKNSSERSIRSRVFETIERERLQPKSRLRFLLQEWFIWIVAGLAFVVGSVSTALTVYVAQASRFVEFQIQHSPLATIFQLVPLFWIILMGVGVAYTVHALRMTKRGYRYHPSWLVSTALVFSMLCGYGVHAWGVSEHIDQYLLAEVPFYGPVTGFQTRQWMQADSGVLAGVIVDKDDDGITLHAMNDTIYTVLVSTSTRLAHSVGELTVGTSVRVVGTTTQGALVFEAERIGPFLGRGGIRRDGIGGTGPQQRMKETGGGMRIYK